jgi:hypothetical protein
MKRIGTFIASFLLLGITLVTPFSASAASNAVGVNPRRDYNIAPGGKVEDTLFVSNLNKDESLTVKIETIDFSAQNETGSPALMVNRSEPTTWSLKPYLRLPATSTIPAGKSIEIPFTVDIPKTVGAGSYYSAVRYLAVNSETGESVSLSSSAVTLMFVRVTGEARSSLTLEQFGAFTPDKNMTNGIFGSFYSATAPEFLSYRLKNNGNVAEQPSGSIILKDTFGKVVKTYENANAKNNIVLIGQTRRIDLCMNEQKSQKNVDGREVETSDCVDPKLKPGRYTAVLGLVYGDNGNASQELQATATFWYLPAWFLIAVGIGLLLIAGLVYKVVRSFKGRGRKTFSRR